jgi:hypothetical protein
MTEGHPYFTQMLCHYLWDYAKQHKRTLDSQAMDTVVLEILQRDSLLFTELWDSLSAKEHQLLKALAKAETSSLYEQNFISANNLGSASSVQKACVRLFQNDYIRKRPSGHITFLNPFFKRWVTQT